MGSIIVNSFGMSTKFQQTFLCSKGVVGVGTVRNMYVPVTIRTFQKEPELLADGDNTIDQINECDLEVSSAKIVIAGCFSGRGQSDCRVLGCIIEKKH